MSTYSQVCIVIMYTIINVRKFSRIADILKHSNNTFNHHIVIACILSDTKGRQYFFYGYINILVSEITICITDLHL